MAGEVVRAPVSERIPTREAERMSTREIGRLLFEILSRCLFLIFLICLWLCAPQFTRTHTLKHRHFSWHVFLHSDDITRIQLRERRTRCASVCKVGLVLVRCYHCIGAEADSTRCTNNSFHLAQFVHVFAVFGEIYWIFSASHHPKIRTLMHKYADRRAHMPMWQAFNVVNLTKIGVDDCRCCCCFVETIDKRTQIPGVRIYTSILHSRYHFGPAIFSHRVYGHYMYVWGTGNVTQGSQSLQGIFVYACMSKNGKCILHMQIDGPRHRTISITRTSYRQSIRGHPNISGNVTHRRALAPTHIDYRHFSAESRNYYAFQWGKTSVDGRSPFHLDAFHWHRHLTASDRENSYCRQYSSRQIPTKSFTSMCVW